MTAGVTILTTKFAYSKRCLICWQDSFLYENNFNSSRIMLLSVVRGMPKWEEQKTTAIRCCRRSLYTGLHSLDILFRPPRTTSALMMTDITKISGANSFLCKCLMVWFEGNFSLDILQDTHVAFSQLRSYFECKAVRYHRHVAGCIVPSQKFA